MPDTSPASTPTPLLDASPLRTVACMLLRHGLTALGAYLAARGLDAGLGAAGFADAAMGLTMVLLGLLWSLMRTTRFGVEAQALASQIDPETGAVLAAIATTLDRHLAAGGTVAVSGSAMVTSSPGGVASAGEAPPVSASSLAGGAAQLGDPMGERMGFVAFRNHPFAVPGDGYATSNPLAVALDRALRGEHVGR